MIILGACAPAAGTPRPPGQPLPRSAIAIINRAIDLGVNYVDTAAAYGRPRDQNAQRWELNGISQTFIGEVMEKAVLHHRKASLALTRRIDKVVLNRFLGVPIFLFAMYLMFLFTMKIGGAFIGTVGISSRS